MTPLIKFFKLSYAVSSTVSVPNEASVINCIDSRRVVNTGAVLSSVVMNMLLRVPR